MLLLDPEAPSPTDKDATRTNRRLTARRPAGRSCYWTFAPFPCQAAGFIDRPV
jgi:hypothetical protein